jgi:uncharacterized protein GlcG (DUF336 family)
VVVGGIGVMADGVYGADFEIQDIDKEAEEIIALAGTVGFDAPTTIRAERITVDGTTLRYSDATPGDFRSNPAAPPAFASLPGQLASVPAILQRRSPGSWRARHMAPKRPATRRETAEFNNRDAFILTNGFGQNRFPIRAATDAGAVAQPLTDQEVRALLEEAFNILSRARGQIRQPLDSRMQATISVVDTNGAVLGIVRSPDAPIFGTDVSLQKARTAMFFSNARAGALLRATPAATIFGRPFGTTTSVTVADFVDRSNAFFGDPGVLQGKFAITNRAVGNVARPYFPDGEVGRGPGAFSRPIESFSPFAVGLQSALIIGNVSQHVGALFGLNADTPMRCTNVPDTAPGQNPLQNGMQIFPGGEPIYRGGQLIGGIGVSGDGIRPGRHGRLPRPAHAASVSRSAIRTRRSGSDRIEVPVGDRRVRLRYVGLSVRALHRLERPENVCQGK